MSDLISRSKLIDYFYFGIDDKPIIDGISDRKIIDIIKNQPTAYDIDKVVGELEERKKEYLAGFGIHNNDEMYGIACGLGDAIKIVKQCGVGKDDDISKEEICEKVRSICKEENVEFLFITEGKSCWSVSKNEHIRKVAHFHKENENMQQTEQKLKEMESD